MTKNPVLYQCPRCGYKTNQKNMMRRHLYQLKKQCPGTVSTIDLDDDIKQHVLANRIWHLSRDRHEHEKQPLTIHQTINNYNTMNNLVTRLDDLTKLMAYTQYNNTPLVNFSDEVEQTYEKRRRCMDGFKSKNIFLENSLFFDAIDDVTSITDLAQLNILYEDVAQKLKIYDDNEWRTVLFDKGITEIIERIKDHYLDVYERYLIRLYYDSTTNSAKKTYIKEHLQTYYRFIACYDLMPYVHDKTDDEVTHVTDNDDICRRETASDTFSIQDHWYPIFRDVKVNLQASYVNRTKKDVANIVKRNAMANVVELNKKVIELIRMDEDFKNDVLVNVIDMGGL